jgi:sugar-specific transcriptional regulator TrmB
MNLETLKELNFSDGQIKVYKAVLELGIGAITEIQEKTGIERRNIYDILNKLIEKGVISYTEEHNKKTYQCTHPSKLLEEIHNKEEQISKLKEQIPKIEELYSLSKPSTSAQVFRGNEGIKALLNEALEYNTTYWIGGNSGVETQTSKGMQLWFKQWMNRRIEQQKVMYDLVDSGTSLEGLKPQDVKKHTKQYYHYATLPENLSSPMVILIFGNKVAQILWSEQSFAFVIESEKLKNSYMKYFDYFWKK